MLYERFEPKKTAIWSYCTTNNTRIITCTCIIRLNYNISYGQLWLNIMYRKQLFEQNVPRTLIFRDNSLLIVFCKENEHSWHFCWRIRIYQRPNNAQYIRILIRMWTRCTIVTSIKALWPKRTTGNGLWTRLNHIQWTKTLECTTDNLCHRKVLRKDSTTANALC